MGKKYINFIIKNLSISSFDLVLLLSLLNEESYQKQILKYLVNNISLNIEAEIYKDYDKRMKELQDKIENKNKNTLKSQLIDILKNQSSDDENILSSFTYLSLTIIKFEKPISDCILLLLYST